MKMETSKGKTYNVDWIDGPTITSGNVLVSLEDGRRLPKIAAELDGLDRIQRFSEEQGDKTFEGYSVLKAISRGADGKVLAELTKEA